MKNLKKHNFAFVNNMEDYVKANETELITKIVIGSELTNFVSLFPEIKGTEAVPVFDTGAIDSIGSTGHCSTVFGDITMDQRNLTVCDFNTQKGYCPEQLSKTLMGLRMQAGSYNETIGAEERFIEDLVAKIAVFTERKFWLAEEDTDCSSGIIEQLDTASATTVNITYSAMTPANALTIVDTYVLGLPDALKFTPTVLFLNRGDYAAYVLALRNANFFAYNPDTQAGQTPMSIMHPASQTMVVSSEIGTGRALLTYGPNLAFGTDLVSDYSGADAWYSKDNKQFRLSIQWRVGGLVFFPELCVRIS